MSSLTDRAPGLAAVLSSFAAGIYLTAAVATLVFLVKGGLNDEVEFAQVAGHEFRIFGTGRLTGAIFAVLCTAVVLATSDAWCNYMHPELSARAIYVGYWLTHIATATGLTFVFLLWSGCIDVFIVVVLSVFTGAVISVTTLVPEWIFYKESQTRRVGWDRTPYSYLAWAILCACLIFDLFVCWLLVSRCIAAIQLVYVSTMVRIIAITVLLCCHCVFPSLATMFIRATNGYMNATSNRMFGGIRFVFDAVLTTAISATFVCEFMP